MSYQPPPPSPNGQPPNGQPQGPIQQMTVQQEAAERTLEQILGGQLPGAEYLFPASPEKRQKNLIKTTPDEVRDALLRAIEVSAQYMLLPYGMEKKGEYGKAILEMSQAYLLLDPTVDNEGLPVGAQAHAQAEATQGVNEHQADMQARVAAHASGAAFERPVTVSGYSEPPRVKPNPAENALAEKHKAQSQELKGARGDKPLPKPRVGD